MNFRGVKEAIAVLFLVFSVAAFGYEESLLEYEAEAFRIVDECGCEKGTLYLYSVDRQGTPHKKRLRYYSTQEACEYVLQTQPPSECPRH